jgi:hypothetical protein
MSCRGFCRCPALRGSGSNAALSLATAASSLLRLTQSACPNPAARKVDTSTPRPEQQSASVPLITTAGRLRMPKLFARRATSGLCISSTVTSHEGHAACLTCAIVSSQAEQPALKISTVRLVAIIVLSFHRCANGFSLGVVRSARRTRESCCLSWPGVPERSCHE